MSTKEQQARDEQWIAYAQAIGEAVCGRDGFEVREVPTMFSEGPRFIYRWLDPSLEGEEYVYMSVQLTSSDDVMLPEMWEEAWKDSIEMIPPDHSWDAPFRKEDDEADGGANSLPASET